MFAACPKCKGWGVVGPVMRICPNCEGLKIVDEVTGLLFEYEKKGLFKDGVFRGSDNRRRNNINRGTKT